MSKRSSFPQPTTAKHPAIRMERHETLITHSGPLPDPDTMRHYNDIVPGAAARIVDMAEREMAERHRKDADERTAKIRQFSRGQWFAFIVSITALGTCCYCAAIGQPWVAGVIGGLDLVALAGVFIFGSNLRPQRGNQPDQEH